jgi:hypothetical protein
MRHGQGRRDFLDDPAHFRYREPAIAVEALLERLALDERHHDVRDAAGFPDVVDRDDACVPQSGDRFCFTTEPLQHRLVHHQLGREDLHREFALEAVVTDRKNFRESTAPDQVAYREVGAERLIQPLADIHDRGGGLQRRPRGRGLAVRTRARRRGRSADVTERSRLGEWRMTGWANKLVSRHAPTIGRIIYNTPVSPSGVKKKVGWVGWVG